MPAHLSTAASNANGNRRKSVQRLLGRPLLWLLCSQTALLAWLKLGEMPEPRWLLDFHLPLHIMMEVFAIIVAAMIFALGWHSFDRKPPCIIVVLSSAFFAVAWIDLGHLLSFPGMPEFVTPSAVSKGINFWLAARLVIAAALLAAALMPWHARAQSGQHYGAIFLSAAVVGIVYWISLLHPDALPETYSAEHGLTAFKVGAEFGLIAAYLLAAVLFALRASEEEGRKARHLFAATLITCLSEICFTLYAHAGDIFNFLGHVYKVIAYAFLYRAVFVSGVREPYEKLQRSEQSLTESELRFRTLMESAPDAILLIDPSGKVMLMNAQAERVFLAERSLVIGTPVQSLIPAWEAMADGAEMACRRANGEFFSAEASWTRLATQHGPLVMAIVRDITQRKKALAEKERLVAILEATPDVISIIDKEMRILYLNRAGRDLAGISVHADDFTLADSVTLHDFFTEPAIAAIRDVGFQSALSNGFWKSEVRLRSGTDNETPATLILLCHKDEDGMPTHWSFSCRDASERENFEKQLLNQLTHDALTGLPNHLRVASKLRQAQIQARARNTMMAVLFLDIDFFKKINNVFGHAHGDAVLRESVSRLMSLLRPDDILARQASDQFVILQKSVSHPLEVTAFAESVLQRMRAPFFIQGHELFLSASIGIALFPSDAQSEEELLQRAHVAMTHAKEEAGNRFRYYTPDMDQEMRARLKMEGCLRRAVENEGLSLHYQPRIRASSGATVGVEALARWNHPVHGNIPPSQFIPLAEKCGLIEAIDMWVVRQACIQARSWQKQGFGPMRISVNLSARQFMLPTLVEQIASVLNETGLDPASLELEITESTIMHDTEAATEVLRSLKRLGVALSIDDFGTGYSSLSYLKLFPIDVLKIDRSFIKDAVDHPEDAAITRAIIALAHCLGMEVVAEGVETIEEVNLVRASSCDEMQGYYFSRPAPPEELARLFRERQALST